MEFNHEKILDKNDFPENPETVKPWEMVSNGRYRPRRIKGSCPGRELG